MTKPNPDNTLRTSNAPDAKDGRRRVSRRRKILFSMTIALLTYAVSEAITTYLYVHGILEPPESVWVVEKKKENGRIFKFDPILGYWLPPTTAKVAVFSDGNLQEFDSFRGNNHGFPDRDDFVAKASDPTTKRIAVFGDSFTAAQFNETNWPDRLEDLAREQGVNIQLLNFSIDGGGLANWWSILTRFVEREEFELDGVLFAVFEDDLQRTFRWRDDGFELFAGDDVNVLGGESAGWDPASFPLKPDLNAHNFNGRVIVQTSDQFRETLHSRQLPAFKRPVRLFLAHKVRGVIARLRRSWASSAETRDTAFYPRRGRSRDHLIRDIRRYLILHSVPAMVVYVPIQVGESFDVQEAVRFANALDATLLDGSAAYAGRSRRDIANLWTGPDDHWNQEGSDLFAAFMLEVLREWP